MEYKLSYSQKLIVDAPIANNLVSAAAGSGKTTVLVERIITKLINRDFEINEILVMTFTREAASNMRSKIDKALRSKITELKKTGNNSDTVAYLYRQLDLLPNSYIQTIDSFCSRVIKEKGYVCLDSDGGEFLEPGTTIIDENELNVLLLLAVTNAISESYETKNDIEAFINLTNMYGNGRTDDSLAESLVQTYKSLRSLPDYLKKCEEIIKDRNLKDDAGIIVGFDETYQSIVGLFESIDDECINSLRELTERIVFLKSGNQKRREAFQTLFDVVESYVSAVKTTIKEGNPFEVLKTIKRTDLLSDFTKNLMNGIQIKPDNNEAKDISDFLYYFGRIAALIKFMKPLIPDCERMPNGYNDSAIPYSIPESYIGLLAHDYKEMLELQKKRTAVAAQYVELIKLIDRNYTMEKGRIHGMDFADQTHLAKKILSFDEASIYYQSKFKEIYIDEYQDNSGIQDSIISCFESPNGNVFRVGDVKQSIYKFRYAEPSLFLGLMNKYDKVSSKDDFDATTSGNLFLLNSNYRSDATVLDFINRVFRQIMTANGAEIQYDETQQLNSPEDKVTEETDKEVLPRVLLMNQDSNANETELINSGVLSEVTKFVESGIAKKDICVLTRSRKKANLLSQYLSQNGLAAIYADELAVFDDSDIHGICNVIIAVGNSYRDEYVLSVLLAPYRFSNFTVNEIAVIYDYVKLNNPKLNEQYLIEKLRFFAETAPDSFEELRGRVIGFIDTFDSLRNERVITDVGELVDRIYFESGLGATLGQYSSKLSMFKDWICGSFLRYGSDISHVAQELESMKIKLGDKTSVRKKDSSTDDAIRCMTFHASKGLEFAAVVVTELVSKGNQSDVTSVYFDSRDGFVINDYCEERVRIDTSIERFAFDEHKLIAENAENLRLLYVALTRAKKRLSIVLPTSLNSDRFKLLYKMVLNSDSGCGFGKKHWINGTKSIEYAFLSGLLRLTGSADLSERLKENCDANSSRVLPIVDDDASFELEIRDVVTSVEEGDDDLPVVIDEASEDETNSEDVVVPKQQIDKDNLIPLYAKEFDDDGYPVFEEYPFEESSLMPFKVSVSGISDGKINKILPLNLTVNGYEYYKSRLNGDVGDTPSEVGTFFHKLMRFIDFEQILIDKNNVSEQLDLLIADGIIASSDKEKAMNFKEGIYSFAVSDIGRKLIAAEINGAASYEKPIVFSLKTDNSNDTVLVQGVIDLLFQINDELIMVDYKTDHYPDAFSSEDRAKAAISRHKSQINYYASAVEKSFGKELQSYLYLVNYGEFVCVSREVL